MSFVIAYKYASTDLIQTLIFMPFAAIIMAPAFVLHELGHKIVAQNFGYAAEYRMWTSGLRLAVGLVLITSLFTTNPWVFIAPGAVYFSARRITRSNIDKVGKIGLAGPLVNLGLVVIFGLVGIISSFSILQTIGQIGAAVNAFLAMFNLIPFPPFDGQKVYKWNKNVWMLVIGLSIASFIMAGGL